MAKYLVRVDWSGYSRGYSTYAVDADSAEEAEREYYIGERTEHEVVRDDTEGEATDVTLIEQTKEK